jgi:hypothetical protein
MHTRYAKASGLALALALMALLALDVEAKWSRYHALGCMTESGQPYIQPNGLLNFSYDYSVFLYCPVADTDSFMKQNITGLNVHGRNGNSNFPVQVYACTTFWNTIGGSCGATAYASGQGDYTLQPSLSAWTSSGDFAYLGVRLPPLVLQGGSSSLRGYFIYGN